MSNNTENRRKKAKTATAVTVTVVTAVVLLLNIVLGIADERYGLSADLSREKYYTISDQTREILGKLEDDVYIYTLYSSDSIDDMVMGLMKSYEAASDKIHVENVDPALNPMFTQAYDPYSNGISTGSVIVTDAEGKNYKVLTVYDLYTIDTNYMLPYALNAEQKVTSTINYMETGEMPAVKLLSGHNETPPAELADLISMLHGLNYDVETYDSSTSSEPLDPAFDILLVVSPREDISDGEYGLLKSFLDEGGNAAFLLDRVVLNEANGTNYIVGDSLDNFNSLLMNYDIALNNDYIIGGAADKLAGKPTAHIPTMYGHAVITNGIIASGKQPVMADVSSLTLSGDGSRSATLLETGPNTWAKDLTSTTVNIDKQEGDATGPFTIAALGENGDSHIAVYGTSSFVSQSEIARTANRDLIINTVNSLKKSGDPVNIAPKSLIPGIMEFQGDAQKTLLTTLVMIILPAGAIIAGLIVWLRRKRL